MELVTINKENCSKLKEYWRELSKNIPYFYPVEEAELAYSLLEDRKYGERMFNYLESYFLEEKGKVLGFIQFGKPHIYWDTKGQKCYDPNIGVIRHIYFREDEPQVGKTLMDKAEEYFSNNTFDNCFAFNHVLGLSCTGYHGKLHDSMGYIADLLKAYGYVIEHENVYYSIALKPMKEVEEIEEIEADGDIKIIKSGVNEHSKEEFSFYYKGEKIGESVVLYLNNNKIVYMNTIWIDSNFSSKGFGTKFIKLICNDLFSRGYVRLDLDTAKNNLGAQRFYERNGFTNEGITRSYWK